MNKSFFLNFERGYSITNLKIVTYNVHFFTHIGANKG